MGLWDEDGCGLGEGTFSGMHEEVEGACAAGALLVVVEGCSVDGEDGPGALPAGTVAGILPVSELPRDGFEGLGADGVEFFGGPSARHRGFLRGLFGGGEGLRVAVGPGVFPVSRFPSPPGAWGWKRFERGAVLVSVGRLDGVSGLDEFVEGGADGLGAHSGGLADLASGEGFAGLGEDGADALSGPGVGRCRRCGFRPDELQGRPLGGGCEFEAEIVEVGCGAVVGGEKDALLATAQDEHVIRPREELGAAPESLSG